MLVFFVWLVGDLDASVKICRLELAYCELFSDLAVVLDFLAFLEVFDGLLVVIFATACLAEIFEDPVVV